MQLSKNIVTPEYLGTERYIVLDFKHRFGYIDISKKGNDYVAYFQTGILHSTLLTGSPAIGTEKKVLQQCMNSILDYWNAFDNDLINEMSWPMPLKDLQLNIFEN